MQLKGTFDSVNFEDILEWLETAERTGALNLENDRFRKSLFFVSGAIVGVASTEPADSLAEQIAERGLLSSKQVDAAVHIQRRTGHAFVDVLHKTGAVLDTDLEAAIERQASEAVLSVFLWESGTFCFREGALPSDLPAAVSLEPRHLVPTGQERARRARAVRASLPSPTTLIRRVVDVHEIAIGSPLEEQILQGLAEPQTVLSLMLSTRASEFAVLDVLDRLLTEKALEVLSSVPAPVAIGLALEGVQGSSLRGLDCLTMGISSSEAMGFTASTSAGMVLMSGASSSAACAASAPAASMAAAASMASGTSVGAREGGVHSASTPQSSASVGLLESALPGAAPDGSVRPSSRGQARALELVSHARRQMELRSYDEALELFRRAERSDPENKHLHNVRRGAESVYCEVLYRGELPPDARPVRVVGPASWPKEISRGARALLERIDGSRAVRALVAESAETELATLVLLRDLKRSGLLQLAAAEREASPQ